MPKKGQDIPSKGDVYVCYRFPELSITMEPTDFEELANGRRRRLSKGVHLNFDNMDGAGVYVAKSTEEAEFIEGRDMFQSKIIVKDNRFVGQAGAGQFLRRKPFPS